MCSLMRDIGVGIDGGKDSLSMAARVEGATVKSPGSLVISAYVTVNDVTRKVTPELKTASEVDAVTTSLIHVDLAPGERWMEFKRVPGKPPEVWWMELVHGVRGLIVRL